MIGFALFLLAGYLYLDGRRRYLSVFLLFVIGSAGFQLIPVDMIIFPGMGVSKPYDWVLIFCGMMFFFFPGLFIKHDLWRNYKNLRYFGVVLILLLLYSIYFRDVEVSISVRVFRNFIFFLPAFLFVNMTREDFIKLFKLIVYATALSCLGYCLQTVTGLVILNTVGGDAVIINQETEMARFYNLPVFIYPVIFFFFFGKHTLGLKYYKALMGIVVLAVLFSQHRNLMLAIFVCYILHLFLSNKIKIVSLVVYAAVAMVVFNVVDNLLGNRFSAGAKDLSHASLGTSKAALYAVDINDLSTTEFRYYLVVERLQYVLLSPTTTLFGIGFLTEDSRQTQSLKFNVGLPDDAGNVTQVDTGDVIWSVMLLQFGLVGILCFVLYYVYFFVKFYPYRYDPISQIGMLYIVILVITSFYGTSILKPYTTCMVVLFAAYTYVLKRDGHLSD